MKLFVTIWLPISLVAFLWLGEWVLELTGLDVKYEISFSVLTMLFISALYFFPIHLLFGESVMSVAEFGPTPHIFSIVFTLTFYIFISYLVSNLIGYFS